MLETKASFMYKDSVIEQKNCVIDKIINLSGAEFDSFSRGLLRDWDFLRDNKIEKYIDEQGRWHCLLVKGEGRRDGILVNAEGADNARYSSFIPNVEDFLTVGRYSALSGLNKKLTAIVDVIAEQAGAANPDGRGVVNLRDWENLYGIDFNTNGALRSTVLAMLDERPEVRDWQLDGSRLIVWRELGNAPDDETLTDPSVTPADMYAYGYTWDGMIPLGKERALELFDKGYGIFRLSKNDAEGAINLRDEIHEYDGLFGTEDPAWVKPGLDAPFQAFIMNTEKLGKNEAVGEWLTLPANAATLQGLLERIGVDGTTEEVFTIAALRMPIEDIFREHISKHDSLDELNMLASFMNDMENYELEKLQAILSTNVADLGQGGVGAIINLLYEDNFTSFDYIDAKDEEALGRYYAEAFNEKPDDVSFAEHGKVCVKEEDGAFFNDSYIKQRFKVATEYDGEVHDEYKIVDAALRGLQATKPERGVKPSERGAEDDKPSVLKEIQESRSAPKPPAKAKPKRNKSKKKSQPEQ